jgi:hypothetical protein
MMVSLIENDFETKIVATPEKFNGKRWYFEIDFSNRIDTADRIGLAVVECRIVFDALITAGLHENFA